MRRFDEAYLNVQEPFQRMQDAQCTYDNQIETIKWPTVSSIGIPLMFTSVEKQLPFAMRYLFPKTNPINLIPRGNLMPRDVVRNIEDNIWYAARTEMNLEYAMIPAIRDCYKFGVGYGSIDVRVVTPPEAVTVFAGSSEGLAAQSREIVLGKPTTQVYFDYIPTSNVVPMPDGAEVEGPNRASGHFVLKLYSEDEFRALYANDENDIMKGDVESIIAESTSGNYDTRLVSSQILAKLAGIDINIVNSGSGFMQPVIPVLKGYFDHEHVWIANGRTTIYHRKDNVQTMRSDLVKLSSWPDGMRWFPMNPVEASRELALGTNIWYNAMFDLAQYSMNPERVINTRMIDPSRQDVPRGPGAEIHANGPASEALSYARGPDFPQQLFGLAGSMETMYGEAMGQPSTVGQGSPGLVRGGANALEALLSETTGRQLLAASILRLGGYRDTFEKILLKRQLLAPEEGESYIRPARDPATGKETYNEYTVTLEDMRNVFDMHINLSNIRLNSAAAAVERGAIYDRMKGDPALMDERELRRYLIADDDVADRLMLPEDVVRANQERLAQSQLDAAQAQATPQGAPTGGQSPGVPAPLNPVGIA
jgi:hypothetical protein